MRLRRFPLVLAISWLTCQPLGAGVALGDEEKDVTLPVPVDRAIDFVDDVQPILAGRCYDCHGAELAEAGLRLDDRASALAGGDSGLVIEAGRSAQSRLIRYVAGVEDGIVMPPDDEPLSAEEIGILRAWIDQGADWPEHADGEARLVGSDHWSFQPPVRYEPPKVDRHHWVRNPIDAFIVAKLESEQVAPSPEADRPTLIRRLYLDLLGLPPTPDAVEAFELDNRPDAYGQLVDELLASPHYGERWGRHWLDQARYADSDGYEKDLPREYAWRWRDWVIDALNRDMPFDQFTIEQLAGDLLPEATIEQRVATGFHRNTLTNREGGVDQEEFRIEAVVDRVNTTGTVWLGLTVGCTQCHSHKYDPLLQREYYGLFAFFNNADEQDIAAPLAEELAAYEKAKKKFDAAHAPLEAAVAEYERNVLPSKFAAWEQTATPPGVVWQVLEPAEAESKGGATFDHRDDGSLLVQGENPDKDIYTLAFDTRLDGITAIRLDVLTDESLGGRGPGRTKHGNFVLSDLKLQAAPLGTSGGASDVILTAATADFSQKNFDVAKAIDGDAKTGWAVNPRTGQSHVAQFDLESPLTIDDDRGIRLSLTLDQSYGKQHTIGRFRIAVTTAPRPVVLIPDDVAGILVRSPDSRTDDDRAALLEYFRTQDAELRTLQTAVEKHAAQAPKYPQTKAQALVTASKPRQTHVHIRGDFLQKGPEVEPHTFAVLPPLECRGEQPDRLDLARWLVDPANPLTARVTVNRIWQKYFGRGLVATDEDFGNRGELPSHPELLDWLATEFIDRGWSMKELHRLIVTSATYRQSSRYRPELAERDPSNVWLARQNRLRLEAEIVRDASLAVGGLLNPAIGGPSIRPALPSGVRELGYANSVKWNESPAPDRHRRGMYIFLQRTVLYPMLSTFDAPDTNVACTRRERSNTPLQALTLLNGPAFVECAQDLGRRIAEYDANSTSDKARWAFRLCLARQPSQEEVAAIVDLYNELLTLCEQDTAAAAEIAGIEDAAAASADVAETAAWIGVGRTLVNLDEFITRE